MVAEYNLYKLEII